MKTVPYTIHDVLGFKLYAYENRFQCLIKTKIELASQFCQLSLIKMSLILKQKYKGNIFPFKLLEGWNTHKAGDYALCDVQYGNPLFYLVSQQDLFDILATPIQFNYCYKILYDVKKEKRGVSTPNIDIIKTIGWKSLDEISNDRDFLEPLPLWESYPVDMRKDPRGSNNEVYYFFTGTKEVIKIQA